MPTSAPRASSPTTSRASCSGRPTSATSRRSAWARPARRCSTRASSSCSADEDSGNDSFILALDGKSGKTVWKTKRPTSVTWTTPALVDVGGASELVAAGNEFVIGYDPATGKELWRTKGLESNTIATPLIGHGLVIVSAGLPDEEGDRDPAGRPRRRRRHPRGLDLREGHVVHPVADPLRRLRLPDQRCRAADVPRRQDGRREVRGRASAGAGQVRGVAGRLRRQPLSHQHRRRHLRRSKPVRRTKCCAPTSSTNRSTRRWRRRRAAC